MRGLMHRIKRWLALGVYYSGALWIYAHFKLKGSAVVLMYHRVLPRDADTFSHRGIVVSPGTFAHHLRFLNKHFQVLTPSQLEAGLAGAGFNRRACLVTFDDGWHDNFGHALPILMATRVPAVVFVTTGFIGTRDAFWQERLTRLLFMASRSASAGHDVLEELGIQHARSAPEADARHVVREAVTRLKARDPAVIDGLLQRLVSALSPPDAQNVDVGEDRFLNWKEIRMLSESGLVTIGSHAHSHAPLDAIGYEAARAEFERSRRELSDNGITDSRICAYPNGDVNDEVVRAAQDAGFTLGFGTIHGQVRPGSDPFRLPRVNVHDAVAPTHAELLWLILGLP